MHMYADTCRGQKMVSDVLELELQVVMSCPTRVLEAKLRFSAREASIHYH